MFHCRIPSPFEPSRGWLGDAGGNLTCGGITHRTEKGNVALVRGASLLCAAFLLERQVAILLRADVDAWVYRLAAHRAAWPPSGNEHRGLGAELSCLATTDAEVQGRRLLCLLVVLLHVVGTDQDAVARLVVAELHPAGAELATCLSIELERDVRGFQFGPGARQLFEHLLQREAERLELLLLHPHDERLALKRGEESKSAVARLAESLGTDLLGIASFASKVELIRHGWLAS